jgi:beta-1,4-N-acetylglucosaminyltransferase
MVEDSSPNGPLTSGAVSGKAEVLLVCSTGGHLLQLLALRDAWNEFSHVWVTFDKSDARSLLGDERVFFAHGPTNRNFGLLAVKNLVLNVLTAVRLLRAVRPKVVLTTGAGVAVPFAWIGRAFGARVVYVESLTRIERPSLSCRLIAPVASRIYGQWPELTETVPRARYLGSVVSGS